MLRRTVLMLMVSLCCLGCRDSAGPGPGVIGEWHLQSVNGIALPFPLPDPPVDKLEIISEVISLLASGRFTDVNSFRLTEGSNVSVETINDEGSYVVHGSTVTLTYDVDGSVYLATVNGDTMTLHDPEIALTFVYRRT